MKEKTAAAIMAHARAEYPRECCGVVAQKSRVERYFPCRNLADNPTEQFHLAPEDYVAAAEWGYHHPSSCTAIRTPPHSRVSWTRRSATRWSCLGR